MAGPWPVRFVHASVLTPFVAGEEWAHDPAVLARATAALGYVPCTFWRAADCPGPCGVHVVCPWCWSFGFIQFAGHAHGGAATWTYNGHPDAPTVSPSVRRIARRPGECAMHVWVRDGQIVDAGTPPHGRSDAIV